MTKEELFDLVAPIHVYLHTGISSDAKAKSAYETLKQVKGAGLVNKVFAESLPECLEDNLPSRGDSPFWKVYCKLFEEMVREAFPTFKPYYDPNGAKCFRDDITNENHLRGECYNQYPYYIQSETLRENLYELGKKVA